jgi:hypothetical protein
VLGNPVYSLGPSVRQRPVRWCVLVCEATVTQLVTQPYLSGSNTGLSVNGRPADSEFRLAERETEDQAVLRLGLVFLRRKLHP